MPLKAGKRGRIAVAIAMAIAMLASVTLLPGAAAAADPVINGPFQPYFAPPFGQTCTVHHFGEGVAPPLTGIPDDPLCVEYAKRDITVTNGGAIRFLLAEPARVFIALPKCEYWQQDHWSVQLAPGTLAVISWDGSYWWDLGAGKAAAILGNLRIAGVPINAQQAAAFVRLFSPALADFFLAYGAHGPGGGFSGTIPFNPLCPK